ncbi:hypothetical protein G7Y89_g4125 [Cudoniella acicularis]|uniref:Glycosyltransferase family 31 protein n=1 Tax=Cudoniella acicularis TaxID=354080 RepID=A0A8H4RQ21_9HELO|nr:hypothetical protein G7Y89_g4125 [Cudoniella acicularis]
MPPRNRLLLVFSLALFAGIVFFARYNGEPGHRLAKVTDRIHLGGLTQNGADPGSYDEHLGWIDSYSLNYPIKYARRDIIATPSANSKRPSVTIVDEPLFKDFSTIKNISQPQNIHFDHCLPPLALEVPHVAMPPADASNMIFGLQTTMGRLKDTVKPLARWLPHTNARLYAIVIENEETAADDKEMATLENEFHSMGMNVTIIHPVRATDSFPQRYFSLVNIMYEARDHKIEWVVCIDDDTLFPSMDNLLEMLSRHDSSKPQYIGSLSEDWWAVNHYGFMGFGGAGIILSTPLAKTIHEHNDDCKEHLRMSAGDISVMDCIYQFSDTKLTHITALHQVDMLGDKAGFYEGGREYLSLHHWKNDPDLHMDMDKAHMVADICDSCFLQRWQFPNEYLLVNGFSITHYPQGHLSGKKPGGVLGTGVGGKVEKINLDQMEETWAQISVTHSLAPLREKMLPEQKVGYRLLDSIYLDGLPGQRTRGVKQIYVKKGGEGEGDTVIALNWHIKAEDSKATPMAPAEQH